MQLESSLFRVLIALFRKLCADCLGLSTVLRKNFQLNSMICKDENECGLCEFVDEQGQIHGYLSRLQVGRGHI